MTSLDAFIVNVAIPTIRADLHTSLAAAELVIAAYVLAYAVLLVTCGRLGDRWSPRTAFLLGLAVFTASSLGCGLAPTVTMLVAARICQGVGAALVYPQVFAIIQLTFAGGDRQRALGLLSGTNGLASIVGQVAGGLLVHFDVFGLSWRTLFLVNVPIGIAGFAAAAKLLPRVARRADAPTLDVGGVVLLTLALLLLVGPLIEGRELGWAAWLLASLAAAAPVFAGFVAYERRLRRRGLEPLVDISLFRQRAIAVGTGLTLLLFAQAGGLFFVLAIVLQTGLGLSPLQAGAVFVPLGSAYMVSTLGASRAVGRLGPRVLTVGYALALVGTILAGALAALEGGGVSLWALVPCLALVTAGNGFGTGPLFGAILADVRGRDAGLAGGAISTAMRVGQALGVAAIGLVFTTALGAAGPPHAGPYVHAFVFAMGGDAVILVCACGLSWALPARGTARVGAASAAFSET